MSAFLENAYYALVAALSTVCAILMLIALLPFMAVAMFWDNMRSSDGMALIPRVLRKWK